MPNIDERLEALVTSLELLAKDREGDKARIEEHKKEMEKLQEQERIHRQAILNAMREYIEFLQENK